MKFRHVVFAGAGRRTERLADLARIGDPVPARGVGLPLDPRAAWIAAGTAGLNVVEPRPGTRWSAEDESFVATLLDRAGLDARAYRQETLRRRLPACLRVLRAASVAEARDAIDRSPRLIGAAVATMVIGVTAFFRDPAVFDHLAQDVLPALGKSRGTGPPRIWSVGCSDGDEVYSIAILLAEEGLPGGTYLLGTDCRPEAIARARDGWFDAAAVRGVPAAWMNRYFEPELPDAACAGTASTATAPSRDSGSGGGIGGAPRAGRRWRVVAPLRSAVQWRTGDVLRLPEPGAWDVILCRNMAMYLRPDAAGRLWQRFEAALRPGGYLVLGKAERPVGAERMSPVAPCIYRRDRG